MLMGVQLVLVSLCQEREVLGEKIKRKKKKDYPSSVAAVSTAAGA